MRIVRKKSDQEAAVPAAPAVVQPLPKQPSEHHMDDAAVSRMDDEGGVPDATVLPAKIRKVASGR